MALVLEAVTLKNGADSVLGSVYTYTSTLVKASGNDRLVVVISSGRSGAARVITSFTASSAGTNYNTVDADGGNAVSTAVGYFIDSELPASAGSHDIDVEWSSTFLHESAIILEFSGADQTTSLENWASNTGTDIAEAGTIAATLAGASGEFGVSYLSITDDASYSTPDASTPPSGFTSQGAASEVTNLIHVATDTSVASASEVLTWTLGAMGTSPYTSVVTGDLSVKAAAAAGGRIMSALAGSGGLAYLGGLAGRGGGLAGR